MALLEVENLTVTIGPRGHGVPILTGVDLSLDRGESLGLVGESGCGKSMTALAVMGLLPRGASAGGAVRLGADSLLSLPERRLCQLRGRRMAMVFQEPMSALNPVKTIGQQVTEGLIRHLGVTRHEADGRARRLLERVGLPPGRFPLSLYPHQLSGGQRQRVVIAIAIGCEPELLIADEPTTALDVTIQAQVLDLIAGLVAEESLALLLITHDLGVVAEMTDRVAVMYAGSVVETGPTETLFGTLAHPYSRGLFAALPQIDLDASAERHRLTTIPGVVPEPGKRPSGCAFRDRCNFASEACAAAPPRLSSAPEHSVLCFHPRAVAA